MKLSTIITAYKNEDIVIPHLKAIMCSSVLPDEIVVVNDGGEDFVEKIRQLKRNVPIIYARINEDITWNYNGACNLGVWLSRGDLLAFEDADNIPHIDCYKCALDVLDSFPEVGRVVGAIRWCIDKSDLDKPSNEWVAKNTIGENQGSYVMRREIYLDLKGQDEKMCGRYGWMFYDWKRRLIGKAKAQFGKGGVYWYVQDGQCPGSHKNDQINYRHLLANTRLTTMHDNHGIMHFTYSVERLQP